jgi:hypothetical protein
MMVAFGKTTTFTFEGWRHIAAQSFLEYEYSYFGFNWFAIGGNRAANTGLS